MRFHRMHQYWELANGLPVRKVRLSELDGFDEVRWFGGPLNILATPASPPVEELARLGVRRISLGSGLHRTSLAATEAGAAELFERGTYGFLA